jgi:dTDP-4-dehydrorhamnose 3,5-epimerase
MIFQETKLKGVYVIEPEPLVDGRGYFSRVFCENEFRERGMEFSIKQVNRSVTEKKGVIRGMHLQSKPVEEAKVIQCTKGAIYDVAVDLRAESPTFKQWVAVELTAENKKMLFIPEGLAHGCQTLVDECEVLYFMSEFYEPKYSKGVLWNDPLFEINWPIDDPTLSDKDKIWPSFKPNAND